MKITVHPKTKITVTAAGATGKSAYEAWLALGNVGTIQDFLNKDFKVFDYVDTTEMICTHNFGRMVSMQCSTIDGSDYNPNVERINMNQVRVSTLLPKSLTIIIA